MGHDVEQVGLRPLGTTGLRVSPLSLGGAALGGEYGDVSDAQAIDTVRLAIERGVNLIDTSPFYGDTMSEHRLGTALADGYRESVILATKAGRYRDGRRSRFDYGYDGVMRSWEHSAERLRTGYFDLYQLHDVEFVPEAQLVSEAWPAMVQLRQDGKVGHIGITGYPLGYLAHLARTLVPAPETIMTYCHYNLLNTSFDDLLLPTVRELGIGVINASVTHMGVLTGRGAPDWHPAPLEIHEVGRQVCELVAARGLRHHRCRAAVRVGTSLHRVDMRRHGVGAGSRTEPDRRRRSSRSGARTRDRAAGRVDQAGQLVTGRR